MKTNKSKHPAARWAGCRDGGGRTWAVPVVPVLEVGMKKTKANIPPPVGRDVGMVSGQAQAPQAWLGDEKLGRTWIQMSRRSFRRPIDFRVDVLQIKARNRTARTLYERAAVGDEIEESGIQRRIPVGVPVRSFRFWSRFLVNVFGSVMFPRYSMKNAVAMLKLTRDRLNRDDAWNGSEAGSLRVNVVGQPRRRLKRQKKREYHVGETSNSRSAADPGRHLLCTSFSERPD
ncbi:hypothetical protein C8J57DRAFT_1476379 [Mycena rebaudengoi]|nr:hypothetical protein C8J57DRAFT_1476379 [Mycena rebaudengoi]